MTDIAEAEPSLTTYAHVHMLIPGRNTHNFGFELLISVSEDVRLERRWSRVYRVDLRFEVVPAGLKDEE